MDFRIRKITGRLEVRDAFFCAEAFPLFRFIAQGGTVDLRILNAHNPACSLNEYFFHAASARELSRTASERKIAIVSLQR